ncbi:NADH-quinone oxidoreductase subunit NuoN [Roseospira marina]|uniref:NADH-quinone oxidoreductase subunit N n=1 Tax=Roseospira marina TaxID=140057 RepID=A0A5M6I9X7_9PROT|nr:NADH-quinone oxidoreductase subunit NuoN [Roseospira marina]KAA5604767.1 NADH-quinone oxidoreductase subunit NuoN [Roseospira marina]MBB4313449.1 NADH-quinone oxidoreductase subunit N [Roseospira marina]MBB5086611.1 NADH-quinone oxidoreductase subunit N [Roseospira marina]
MTDLPSMLPALPEIVLALVAMGLLMYGVFSKTDRADLCTHGAVAAMVAAAVLEVLGIGTAAEGFFGQFVVNDFTRFAKLLILVAAAVTLVMGRRWLATEGVQRFEFPVLMTLSVVGMMLMVSANDLIGMYLGLELQSLALYVLATIQRDNVRATEAGLKYFVLGALASGLLLYGASLVYGFAGTTSFPGIQEAIASGNAHLGVVVGLVFVMAGLSFKVSAAPFHMWTPDVYEGAPTPVTALFAVAPKVAALCLFLRLLMDPFVGLVADWQQVVSVIALLSMIVGSFGAIAQDNIKRLMAYSSIGHMGFALVGLAAGTADGVRGVLVYLVIYLFMNVGTFAIILAMRQQGRPVEGIKDLAGLGRTRPLVAVAMGIFMFSMAGIPPLAGFFAKFYVFMAAVEVGLIWLAILGVLASVVSAFYYLRIVKVMYFDEPLEGLDPVCSPALRITMGVAAAVVLFFCVAPGWVVGTAETAAAALVAG